MKILAVDTTFGACSVAVRAGETLLARRFERMERGHAEALAPMVEGALRESGVALAELERLGVTTGPGTFTGQRVGLAFMRGLRIALKRPLVGITSLHAMAHQAMDETACVNAAAIHDARREEVYFEVAYKGASGRPQVMKFANAVSDVAELARSAPVALAGTAAPRVYEKCVAKGAKVTLTAITAPDADWVARLCAAAPLSAEVPRALYLREPDAKRSS
jgi:tRNA threonylcarbamoyladenosine biosynthesis protein TsaB